MDAANAEAAAAEQQIAEASSAASDAEARLAAVRPKAAKAERVATGALAEVESIETELAAERSAALEQVRRLESDYEDDKRAHDDQVATGLGFGIGALILGLIGLAWHRFRRLPPNRWLAAQGLGFAVGAVIGVAFVVLLVGGTLLQSSGVGQLIGALLVMLALGAPVALLLARRSLRVERGVAEPITSRERQTGWVAAVVGVILLLVAAGGLGDALTADEPDQPQISAQTRGLADAAIDDPLDPPTEELIAARQAAEPLAAKAERLTGVRDEARAELSAARRTLRSARGRLSRAELTATRASERIAAQQAPPETPSSPTSGCDPNYSGCVPPYPPDVDCSDVGGPVTVTGSDPHGLDADNDGVGCES